jgi:hypothetical protein
MIIKLYQVDDKLNKLDKTLNNEIDVNGDFRGSVDTGAPTINLVGAQQYQDFNYCYIPDLDRYYFIENMRIERKNYLICDLKIDVLQSFKDKIKTGYGTAVESENGNNYIDGFVENTDVRPIIDKYDFIDKFNHKGNYYLVTTVAQQ